MFVLNLKDNRKSLNVLKHCSDSVGTVVLKMYLDNYIE